MVGCSCVIAVPTKKVPIMGPPQFSRLSAAFFVLIVQDNTAILVHVGLHDQ